MKTFDKLDALHYLANNNPLCDNCLRADLEEIRIAAGLYRLVREIVNAPQDKFTMEYLDDRISAATTF